MGRGRLGVPFGELLPAGGSCQFPLARRVAAQSVFFNCCLSLTTPLLGHSLLCPYVVDVTDTDCDAKAGLQLCLDPAGRNLRVSSPSHAKPYFPLSRSTCPDAPGHAPGMPRRRS